MWCEWASEWEERRIEAASLLLSQWPAGRTRVVHKSASTREHETSSSRTLIEVQRRLQECAVREKEK